LRRIALSSPSAAPGRTAFADPRRPRQAARRGEYGRLKEQWRSISKAQAARFSKWRERRSRVDRDVRRTDRAQPFFAGEGNRNVRTLRSLLLTYSLYNFDLSYCQGMSDLAAPLLFVMRDEAEARPPAPRAPSSWLPRLLAKHA